MPSYKDFEELPIWKDARELTREVYMLTNQREFKNDRGLRDQLQRSIVSVGSNIAEGFDRSTDKDFAHFLSISKASIAEVRAQLYFALDLGYITDAQQTETNRNLKQLGNQVGGFIQYLRGEKRNRAAIKNHGS
ncbi:four helix bundle protein [Pelagicoccus sp. SDUM812003]|uniref:four helix bundle protein n=1 Tax=Pelagicoccus sp. SDUM812003 TaxID=3041267 RepID=UPI00280FB103|nr:four helix bundle protein [Pelagicoccus sp. SDUM812003]MDQ8204983.1 four helix bundle protein [Pelagicoccus sp. SDUM812003]